jgi:hypothetical protein
MMKRNCHKKNILGRRKNRYKGPMSDKGLGFRNRKKRMKYDK